MVTGAFLIKGRVQSLKAGKGILVMLVLVAGVLAIATYRRNEVVGRQDQSCGKTLLRNLPVM